jgi:hypothetical protein
MAMKYIDIVQSKALQIYPNWEFWFEKQTVWQRCKQSVISAFQPKEIAFGPFLDLQKMVPDASVGLPLPILNNLSAIPNGRRVHHQ